MTIYLMLLQVFLEMGKEYILNEKYSSVDNLSLNDVNIHKTEVSIKRAYLWQHLYFK